MGGGEGGRKGEEDEGDQDLKKSIGRSLIANICISSNYPIKLKEGAKFFAQGCLLHGWVVSTVKYGHFGVPTENRGG